ncbi:hypothetical protein [Pseudomonas viridiflava]|uniref:hypothetical protein n=1 Tax=Pseudomonas viridiflava TaxID=33069 RepID=UPI000F015CAB|nr:hypothetical protein [Pseudomonas viridiflava]
MAQALNTDLIFRMVAHWLNTKPGSYYGSTYGAPNEDLLQKPLNSPIADAYLAKMFVDIPVLAALPPGIINIYAENEGVDVKRLYIEVSGQTISLSDLSEVSRGNY